MPDLICCPTCHGEGRAPLWRTLQETLDLLRARGPLSATQLHEMWQVAHPFDRRRVTAINNRLEELRDLGFVERERAGRGWVYRAVERG